MPPKRTTAPIRSKRPRLGAKPESARRGARRRGRAFLTDPVGGVEPSAPKGAAGLTTWVDGPPPCPHLDPHKLVEIDVDRGPRDGSTGAGWFLDFLCLGSRVLASRATAQLSHPPPLGFDEGSRGWSKGADRLADYPPDEGCPRHSEMLCRGHPTEGRRTGRRKLWVALDPCSPRVSFGQHPNPRPAQEPVTVI